MSSIQISLLNKREKERKSINECNLLSKEKAEKQKEVVNSDGGSYVFKLNQLG